MSEVFLDDGSRMYQYLRPSSVRELFEQHSSGKEDNHKMLFSLIVFEEWLRTHQSPVAAMA